ncbi:TonB-dependent receptor [candidate division KSB1 bacterium]|nr:TonB-dependent receptor [candidate division KSB1 bacterium]
MLTRTFLLSFILLLSGVTISSQDYEVKGSVVDLETGTALPRANIMVMGTSLGTSSDENGQFKLRGLPELCRLQVSVMGYNTIVRTISLSGDGNEMLIIKLAPTVLPMEAITVTGEIERNVIKNPALESTGLELSTSAIQQREIRQQGAKTVVDALHYLPSALIESRGRKVKQFVSLRGQRYPYPEYSINGAWQREFHETPFFFSAADIERIEVIRSSAALLNGVNGMAGLINIVTKEYDAPKTVAELEYGTYDSYRAHLSHGAGMGSLSYATALSTMHTSGPADMNAEEGATQFYGQLKWRPNDKLDIGYTLLHFDGMQELRLAVDPAMSRLKTEISRFDPFQSTLMTLRIASRLTERTSTELIGTYANRDPDYIIEYPQRNEFSRASERDSEWGVNLLQAASLSGSNTLRFGGLYNRWIAPNGKRFYAGRRNDISTFSAVVVDEHQFGALTIDAGLRWSRSFLEEYGAFSIEGSSSNFTSVDAIVNEWEPALVQGSVGGSLILPGLTSIHLNLAAGEIQPRRGTLDNDLRAPKNEKHIKLDAGLRSILANVLMSLTGFLTQQQNAIVLSGKTAELNGRLMELYLNRDQEQYGIEFEARMTSLMDALQGFLNITAMKTRARQDGVMRENREFPEVMASCGLYLQKNNIDSAVLAKYVSFFENNRFAAPAPDGRVYPQPLGDFVVADVNAGYSIGERARTRFYVEIKNIFDTAYSTTVGYPDFGRTIRLGIRQTL